MKDPSKFRPYREGTWDHAAFLLKTDTPLQEVTMRTMLPLPDEFNSPFIGKPSHEIVEDVYLSLRALEGHRHLFSSHVFVEIDKQTARDHNTVSIWSDSAGEGWECRRCEFGALMYNLHPLEDLAVDLHQLCAEGETLTVGMMEAKRAGTAADRLERRARGLSVPDSAEDEDKGESDSSSEADQTAAVRS